MKVAVLGAGPHGREIASSIAGAVLYDDKLDEFPPTQRGAHSFPWIAGAAWPKVRRQIVEHIGESGVPPRDYGRVFFVGSRISPSAAVGAHTHIGYNAVVAHGSRIGEYVNICPGAVISGESTVEDGVFVGANATILHGGITVGAWSIIGAGAVVTKDVPAGSVVKGVPAC